MSESELRNKVIELLPKTSLFGGVDIEDIDFLIDKLIEKKYSAGEIIYEEGGKPGDSYLILEGDVNLIMAGKAVAKFGPGMIFGIASPIGIQKQLVTAAADTDVVVAVIPKMTLYILEEEKPLLFGKVILNVARDLARHLQTLKEIKLTSQEEDI